MENNYQLSRIHNYVSGLMTRKEMHELEQEALNDPFLQDAIDGYRLQNGVDSAPLSLLQKRLAARVTQRGLDRNRQFFGWQRLAIALVAAVMFVVVCSLLVFRHMHSAPSGTPQEMGAVGVASSLRVQIVPAEDSDAKPLKGWQPFSQKLNDKLVGVKSGDYVDVRFEVVKGHAAKISFTGSLDQRLTQKISETIRQEMRWEGSKANFRVHIGEE